MPPPSSSLPSAERELLQSAFACDDGIRLAQLARRWGKLTAARTGEKPAPLKIAILSEGSAETYLPQLRLLCAARGHDFQPFLGTFDGFSQDILDPSSKLHEFRPDITLLHFLPTGAMSIPAPLSDKETVAERAGEEARQILNLCDVLHQRSGCEIILTHFEPPWNDPLAGLPPGTVSPTSFLQAVNLQLAEKAPPFVHLLDAAALVTWMGRDAWHDPRLWHHARQPMSHDGIVLFARKFAGMVAALRGTSSKCLVLDLDHTLWGGIIGDDGLEGIRLGEGSAEGEAYKAFQTYLAGLRHRGVLLAVCSKNEEASARLPFLKHPEMVLKLEDICCFVANWESKADNCLRIARQLNLMPDALVFVDDNASEREMIRQFAPQVRVLDLPEDASLFPRALERAFLFESTGLTPEDLQRAAAYQADTQRRHLEARVTDMDSFLKSLEMTALAGPYRQDDAVRIAQLFHKSNQFNLCTRRYTEKQIETVVRDPAVLSFQIRLADRFGDHGLISMAHFRPVDGRALRLENWVMSCRVLKRGVEQLMLNLIAAEALRRGLERIEFDYHPTPKNGLVRDLYHQLGLQHAEDLGDGAQRWFLDPGSFHPFPIHIALKPSPS